MVAGFWRLDRFVGAALIMDLMPLRKPFVRKHQCALTAQRATTDILWRHEISVTNSLFGLYKGAYSGTLARDEISTCIWREFTLSRGDEDKNMHACKWKASNIIWKSFKEQSMSRIDQQLTASSTSANYRNCFCSSYTLKSFNYFDSDASGPQTYCLMPET